MQPVNILFRLVLLPILITLLVSSGYAKEIGNNYEQQMPVRGVKAPSVRIESLKKIKPGETVDLTAYATVDTKHNGEPFFYWYAAQGTFTLHPSYPDYSTVTYTAPNTSCDVTITAQVGDTLGYVGTDKFTLTVLGATNGKGNPPVLQNCTYRVSPKDWQNKYHATYRLTIETTTDAVPVGHVSIQPTTGNLLWKSSGTVRLLVNGTAVNIYKDAAMTRLIGKSEIYHAGYGNIDIYFNAGFSTNQNISIEQREDLYGKWLVDWLLKATCPGPGNHNKGTADLIVDTAEAKPFQLGPGATTLTRARVSNIGSGPADASALACYLSTNGSTWDAADTLLYRQQFSSIIDGRNTVYEQNVTIPSNLSSGDYYLIFRADDQGSVAETNESNNTATVGIEVITGADLTVSNTGVSPANVMPGQPVTLSATVTNSGGTGTLATSRLGYYLSADATWDSADTLLRTDYFGSLLPGQSQSFSQALTLPADLPFGQQYIVFYADYAGNVPEANENNNQASVGIQVAADQRMTVITPDATTSWAYDRQQTIQWSSNLGGTVKIDLYKGTNLNRAVAAAAPNTGSFVWTVPADLNPADNYWIKITSNADSSVSDDSDQFSIIWPETLSVLAPASGDVFGLGTTRNITWKSSFNGTVDIDLYKAGAFARIINHAVPTVSSSDGSYAWSIPSDLAEGADYQIKVTHSADPSTTDLSDGSFTIANPNTEKPLAKDDAAVTEADTAVLISVLANDNPPEGETLEVTAVSDPANGTALINGDDSVTYTPDFGFTGSDSFTYTVKSPSRGTATASVYVTVQEEVNCDSWALPPDVQALARDDAGNIFAVGTFKDSITLDGETLTAPVGMPALYIAKYTSSGSLLWTRKAVAGEYGIIEAKAAVDTTGNLYLSGSYYSEINFYTGEAVEKTLSGEPGCAHDIFIAKYTPSGALAWAEQAGGQWDDSGDSLTVDSATGRLYIGGLFIDVLNLGSGASSTTLNSVDDNTDPFIAQYTLDGTLLWAKQVDGGLGSVLSVAAKGADSVLATGYYEDSITFSGTSPITLTTGDATNFFVAEFRMDSGDVRWAQKANGTSNCTGRAVAADDSGAVYVAGDFRQSCDFYDADTVFKSLTSFGQNDLFMIKYRADGTPEWLRQGGGASYDLGQDVTFAQDNNLMVIGTCDQYPVAFTIDTAGNTATSNTSCAAVYDRDGSFQGFAEPGDKLVLAETSAGNSVIIGREGMVAPCGSLLVNIPPPAAAPDTANTVEGQIVDIRVLDNDADPEGDTLSISNVTQGANGFAAIEPDGLSVTYTPNPDFIGTDSFTYTVSDGKGGLATALVTIIVRSSASALSVTDILPTDSSAVTVNQLFTFTLNEPVTAGSCYSSISLKDSGSTPVAANTTVSGNILTVEPAAVLAAGTEYLITVPVCSLKGTTGGNTLAADFTHTFTTESGSTSVLFINIAAGYDHAIALDSDGNVWAWGKNDYGQAGDSSLTDQLTPVQVQGLTGITQIAAGAYHNLALDSFGTVWAWGQNGDGQLGNGTQTTSSTPVQVSGLSDVIAIAAGTFHSIALKGDGTVWTWGMNISYALGHGLGGSTDELVPGQVPNLFNVVGIAGGYYFTAVLKQDKTVWSWGRNRAGQLCTGDTTDRNIPVAALLPATVNSIHASLSERAFAVMTDGSVWGWGYNGGFGAVGNGNGWDQPTPVKVFGNAAALSGGGEHTVALAADGSLWAWGRNMEGEYGTGNTSYSTTPVSAADLADVTAVAAGGYFTTVLKANGTIWCWGANYNGQLGNNTTENALTPVQVVIRRP